MIKLQVSSTLDGSLQTSLFYLPKNAKKVPLVVGLHTWSFNSRNLEESLLPLVKDMGWALLLPEFRGPSLETSSCPHEACGSLYARQDILDVVEYVLKENPTVLSGDDIFLLGGSGGGHMSLLMAAYAPMLWKAVAAWCPITDLKQWYRQNQDYALHIAACCGGTPETDDDKILAEYRERSPMHHLAEIAQSTVYVYHGRQDAVVPFSHSLNLFLALNQDYPNADIYLEIFKGGHDINYSQSLKVFKKLYAELSNAERIKITG